MTFADLASDCYRRLNFPSSPSSDVTTRIKAFLNETQQEILSEPGMGALLNGSITFASVASQPQYALPDGVVKVKSVYETTNDQKLGSGSLDWYRRVLPDTAAVTGTPHSFVDLGFTSIAVQPSDASSVFADSTSASDTNTLYLEGYRTGGIFASKSVVMTGTTAVNVSSAVSDWVFLTKCYLSAAAVGDVTLVEDASGGTVLATIGTGFTMARHRQIALVPTPASVITYTVDFELTVPDMVNDKDEPVLPTPFHRLLATGARMKEYEKTGAADLLAMTGAQYSAGLRKLKFWLYTQSAGNPNLRGPRSGGWSQLGGQFPAGS